MARTFGKTIGVGFRASLVDLIIFTLIIFTNIIASIQLSLTPQFAGVILLVLVFAYLWIKGNVLINSKRFIFGNGIR